MKCARLAYFLFLYIYIDPCPYFFLCSPGLQHVLNTLNTMLLYVYNYVSGKQLLLDESHYGLCYIYIYITISLHLVFQIVQFL